MICTLFSKHALNRPDVTVKTFVIYKDLFQINAVLLNFLCINESKIMTVMQTCTLVIPYFLWDHAIYQSKAFDCVVMIYACVNLKMLLHW